MITDTRLGRSPNSPERAQPIATPARGADRRRIVVGVDDSDASAAAVAWAAEEAAARGVELHIVHAWAWQVLDPWSHSVDRMVISDLTRRGRAILRRFKAQAAQAATADNARPRPRISTECRRGYPPDVLSEVGEDAALIVVGTHRLSPLGRVVLGSVSTALVARAHCPVVVLAPPAAPAASGTPSVVVGIAGTPDDARVLEFAFGYASQHGCALRALYFWDPLLADMTVAPPPRAQAWLAESLAGWREEFPDVPVRAEVVHDHAVRGLVGAAGPHDLLVVGRRANRLRFGTMLGSTSLGVLHHASGPVAIIPPPTGTDG